MGYLTSWIADDNQISVTVFHLSPPSTTTLQSISFVTTAAALSTGDSISLGLCKQLNWVSRIRGWLAQHWNNKQIPGDIIGVVSVCRWHESKLEIFRECLKLRQLQRQKIVLLLRFVLQMSFCETKFSHFTLFRKHLMPHRLHHKYKQMTECWC